MAAPRSVFIVGSGRVGTTLARLLPKARTRVIGTWARTPATARRARRISGARSASGQLPARILEAELVFLTVPDDAIESMATRLVQADRVAEGQLFVHCSGAHGLAPLSSIAAAGGRVGSLHPLQSFSDPRTTTLDGVLAVLDGVAGVQTQLRAVARRLGMKATTLRGDENARALYHAAAVTASGQLTALLDLAFSIAQEAGLSRADAVAGLLALARGTLDNLARTGSPEKSLTGPVPRGDTAVVGAHLGALRTMPRPVQTIYRELLRHSVDIARRGSGTGGRKRLDAVLRALDT